MIRPALLAALALILATAPAGAQAVRGTLVDAEGRFPVAGALMVLVDGAGRTRAEVLTDSAGRFLLRAPAPGSYTVRAERIGHRSTASAAVELEAGATREVRIAAPAEPVRLAAVSVSAAGRRCTVRPEAVETALLWEEARKALRSSTATRRQYPYHFQVRRSFRQLDPQSETVISEEMRSSEAFTATPFASLSVEALTAGGYVQMQGDTAVFLAPDAEVLLSDVFLDAHCFQVRPADAEHAGMIGLAFEPVRGSRQVGVNGVLWLDQATAELRVLEYGYRNLPASIPAHLAGGRVQFQRLPSGAWIIPQWRIRMPREGAARPDRGGQVVPGLAGPAGPRITLSEEVGEVVAIRTASGTPVVTTAFASVSGVVYDSIRGAPLAGARVTLAGTDHGAVTDAEGRFRMDGISEGAYALSFSHPRLDSVGYQPAPARVRLVPPTEQHRALSIPSLTTIRTAACPARGEGRTALVGVVATPGGDALPGAVVTAYWQAAGASGDTARAVAVADARGVYRLCELPAGPALRLEARFGADTTVAELRVDGTGPSGRDLAIATTAAPVQSAGAARSPRVMGRLVDADNGRPIVGATVRFSRGIPEQQTDRRGGFVLEDVAEGTYGLEFHHERYGGGTSQVTVRGGGATAFELRLPRRTVTLESVTVTAERVRPSDFVRARRRPANFIDRQQIERRPTARHVGDMLREVPGLNVREIPYPGMPGSIAELCVEARGSTGGTRSLESSSGIGSIATSPLTVVSRCRGVAILFDDVLISSDVGDFLRSVPLSHVETIEYVGAADAAGLYPISDGGGLLIIYTRGFAPRVLR